MSERSSPFHCIHCGYDLSSLRGGGSVAITSPECGNETYPYNQLSPYIRRQPPTLIFLKAAMIWALPGVLLGGLLFLHVFMTFLILLALYPPTRFCEKLLSRIPRMNFLLAKTEVIFGSMFGFLGCAVCTLMYLGSL